MSTPGPIHFPGGEHAALLLHGLCGSPLEVRFVGRLLQRAGFTVHVPTIEGYTAGTPASRWQQWLRGAESLYDELAARHRSVSVGGLSVGATLALALAVARPRLPCLALWSVTLDFDGWLMPWYRWLFEPCYRLGIGRRYVYREAAPYGLKNEKWRGRVAEAVRRSEVSIAGAAAIPADFLYQGLQMARAVTRRLPEVLADALIVHSADDETASPRNARLVHERIGSARKRKILLGDSYHLITMDNERDLVARETIRFFQLALLQRHPQEDVRLVSTARALLRLQRRHAGALPEEPSRSGGYSPAASASASLMSPKRRDTTT